MGLRCSVHAESHEGAQRLDDLSLFGEATRGVLREHQVSIRDDVEHAVVTLDQPGLDPEVVGKPGPQTGGPRKVVSTHAIRDRDIHLSKLLAPPSYGESVPTARRREAEGGRWVG